MTTQVKHWLTLSNNNQIIITPDLINLRNLSMLLALFVKTGNLIVLLILFIKTGNLTVEATARDTLPRHEYENVTLTRIAANHH